jgi:hypothetical protein
VAQGHSETRPKNIKGVIPFDTGLLYETAVLFTDKKLVLPADTNAGGPLVLSNKGKLHGFRDYYQCACGAQEAVVHVSVDTVEDNPNKLPKKVGEAFSSVLSLLGGNEEGKERHVVPRDLVRWKQFSLCRCFIRFRSRAPRKQPNSENGNRPRWR